MSATTMARAGGATVIDLLVMSFVITIGLGAGAFTAEEAESLGWVAFGPIFIWAMAVGLVLP